MPGPGRARSASTASTGSHRFRLHAPTTWDVAVRNEEANLEALGPRSNRIRTNKYTTLNFLPKNLYEQFHRTANIFFLFMAVIATIPATQALNPETAAAPLAAVLLVTLIRDFIEDRKRALSDIQINGKMAHVFTGNGFKDAPWASIQNGDIIRVDSDEAVPADILVLCSANHTGVCHIETANLDGESALKVREALDCTHAKHDLSVQELNDIQGHITVPAPDSNLFSLDGNATLKGVEGARPFSLANIILRGCDLRNTDYVYGLVIYTGHDSKIMMNATKPRLKRTIIDRMMNIQILGVFFMLFCMCVGLAVYASDWTRNERDEHFYVDSPNGPTTEGIVQFFGYVLLLHSMIPLSAYVSVELVKLAHARFIGFDLKMYDADTDTPALARTSALSEELGMVRYLLSDKTGTITQNLMEFAGCSIMGSIYGQWNAPEGDGGPKSPAQFEDCPHSHPMKYFHDRTCFDDIRSRTAEFEPFLLSLALCNDVIPERKGPGNLEDQGPDEYHAQSPDEVALVQAARDLGVSFYLRDNDSLLYVNFLGEKQVYRYLENIEFSSERKRMTAFIERVDKEDDFVYVFCKGADDMIISLLDESVDPQFIETTQQHLRTFAQSGLRTLVFSYRKVSKAEFSSWHTLWHDATVQAVSSGSNARLVELALKMESKLILLGATAVDDKLQEDAPETIENLRKANISVWVLTGDKQETAVSIGYAIRLLGDDLDIVYVNASADKVDSVLQKGIDKVRAPPLGEAGGSKSANPSALKLTEGQKRPNPYAVVVDGPTLATIFGKDELKEKFAQLAAWSSSLICCRAAPMQKAQVVNLVRKRLRAITMAIGDGANDVSMINAADIGVGISGKEGRQAVLASDYAIAKFKFLHRLLIVHGRWSYKRVAMVVLYFFYKNYAYILVNFWFAWLCVASAQTIYDQRYIMLYNVIFTSIPGLIVGVLDQDLPAEVAVQYPKLYRFSQNNASFTHKIFWLWILDSMWQSAAVFGIGILGVDVAPSKGIEYDLWEVGTVMFTAVVIIVNVKLMLDSYLWTKPLIWSVVLSVLAYVAFLFIYQSIIPDHVFSFKAIFHLIIGPQFWFCTLLSVIVALFPTFVLRYYKIRACPSPEDILREREYVKEVSHSVAPSSNGRNGHGNGQAMEMRKVASV